MDMSVLGKRARDNEQANGEHFMSQLVSGPSSSEGHQAADDDDIGPMPMPDVNAVKKKRKGT